MARPVKFTKEIQNTICERMIGGESLSAICADKDMPDRMTVFRWAERETEFRYQYARARDGLMDFYADQIVKLAFDSSGDVIEDKDGNKSANHANVARDRLKIDTLKWLMSKLAPKRYGDRLSLEHATDEVAQPINRIELVGVPSGGSVSDLMASIDGRTRSINKIERVIVGWEDRKPATPDAPAVSPVPPAPPPQITYQPTPPPADLTPEAWSAIARVSDLIERIAPGDEKPEHVFGLIEGFLRSHYVSN